MLFVLGVLLSLGSAPVLAGTAVTHPFLPAETIDGSDSPQGSFSAIGEGGFAIDQASGHIVVNNYDNGGIPAFYGGGGVVHILDSSGNYLSQVMGGDLPGLPSPSHFVPGGGVAVDSSEGPSNGNIYVVVAGGINIVFVFDSAGHYLSTLNGSNTPAGVFGADLSAVAVDSSGNAYVVDQSNKVVDVFDSQGKYLSQFSIAGLQGQSFDLATDSSGNLYFAQGGYGIAKFNSAGVFQFVFGDAEVRQIDVDPSSGDVYANEVRYLAQYDSAGNLLGRFGNLRVSQYYGGVAVNGTSGKVYAINTDVDTTPFLIDVFAPGVSVTTPDASIEATDNISYFDATFHGTVNPEGVPTSYHFEYRGPGLDGGANGGSVTKWASTPEQDAGSGNVDVPVSATVHDLQKSDVNDKIYRFLADGKTYEVRLVATNKEADASTISSSIDSFKTLAVPPPEATIGSVSNITASSAHLSGTATLPPPGFETTYQFQISTDGTNWTNSPSGSAGAGTGEVAVSGDISGLVPNSQYFVRLQMSNPGGTSTSAQQSFKTPTAPPAQVETIPAGAIAQTSARLGGWVNPSHSPSSYWFEYGADASYGTALPLSQDADAGSGSERLVVTQDLGGLQPNTTYHYRIVAKNVAGTSAGEDLSFQTDDPAAAGPPDRGFELVNSADKANQPIFARFLGDDGQQVLWSTPSGAPGSPTGTLGLFRAFRTESGWQSKTVMPPADQLIGGGSLQYEVKGVADDGSRLLYSVHGALSNNDQVFARVDTDGKQLQLGERFVDPGFGEGLRGNQDLSHVYFDTILPVDPADKNKEKDLYTYDSTEETWKKASDFLLGDVDPLCAISTSQKIPSGNRPAPSPGAIDELILFSTAPSDCSEAQDLYLRDTTTGTTNLLISGGSASFLRASNDGKTVVFATKANVTGEDTNPDTDVYRWQEGEGATCLTCVVADADVESNAIMVSPDLSHVYFASPKELVAGRSILPREYGLYEVHAGQLSFVAPINEGARGAGGGGGGSGVKGFGESFAYSDTSTDGTIAIFKDSAPGVTADSTGAEAEEIYRYDATTQRTECLSCPPSGKALGGMVNATNDFKSDPHNLTGDGTDVVFETSNALLPSDVNRAPDIYEWRGGVVRLVTNGLTEYTTPAGGGQIGLLLGGLSPEGANLLLRVNAPLTGYEQDHVTNLYVARAGGGFPPPPAPPAPCVEDACQGPLQAPPNQAAIASGDTSGPANQSAGKKKAGKRHHHKHKRHHSKRKSTTRQGGQGNG